MYICKQTSRRDKKGEGSRMKKKTSNDGQVKLDKQWSWCLGIPVNEERLNRLSPTQVVHFSIAIPDLVDGNV